VPSRHREHMSGAQSFPQIRTDNHDTELSRKFPTLESLPGIECAMRDFADSGLSEAPWHVCNWNCQCAGTACSDALTVIQRERLQRSCTGPGPYMSVLFDDIMSLQ